MFTVYNPVADGTVVLVETVQPSLSMSEMGQVAVGVARKVPLFLRVTSQGETGRYSLPSYEVEFLVRPVFGDPQTRERTMLLVAQRRENNTVFFIADGLSEIWPKVADEARGVIASVRFPDPASYQFVLNPTRAREGVVWNMRAFYPNIVVSVACTGTGWFSINVANGTFTWVTSCPAFNRRVNLGKLGSGSISIDVQVSDVKSLTLRVAEEQ